MIKDIKDISSGDTVYAIAKYVDEIREYRYMYEYRKIPSVLVKNQGVCYPMNLKDLFKTREDAELELIKRKI